jgi:hypothetical protein
MAMGDSPMTGWQWNGDYKDLGQVEEFYPAYLDVLAQITGAGGYPYNVSFKGRIPGIAGPREDTAIYLLQVTRSVRDMQAKVAGHLEAGWRGFDPAEVDGGAVRYAGVAEYGWYMSGTGFREWPDARLARSGTLMMVLPGRARTRGHLVGGQLIVKDVAA